MLFVDYYNVFHLLNIILTIFGIDYVCLVYMSFSSIWVDKVSSLFNIRDYWHNKITKILISNFIPNKRK